MDAENMVMYLSNAAIAVLLGYICLVDSRRYIIHNESLCLLAAAAAVRAGADRADIWGIICGTVFAFGVFACVFYVGRGTLGAGDVKLAAVLGFWLGWPQAAIAVYLSFVLGGTIAAAYLAARLKGRSEKIAFAPIMVTAAVIAHFWGEGLYAVWRNVVCGT